MRVCRPLLAPVAERGFISRRVKETRRVDHRSVAATRRVTMCPARTLYFCFSACSSWRCFSCAARSGVGSFFRGPGEGCGFASSFQGVGTVGSLISGFGFMPRRGATRVPGSPPRGLEELEHGRAAVGACRERDLRARAVSRRNDPSSVTISRSPPNHIQGFAPPRTGYPRSRQTKRPSSMTATRGYPSARSEA